MKAWLAKFSKSPMGIKWQEYSDKFAMLLPREKRVVSVAVVFGILYLGFVLVVDPNLTKARVALKSLQQARADANAMQPLLIAVTTQNVDPDAANRQQLEHLKRQLAESGERMAKFQAAMVPPERMQGFLEALLRQNRHLELISLKTLPVTVVGTSGEPAATTGPEPVSTGIYQHGMEVVLAGGYNELLSYLAELERMPQRVMWNSVSLTSSYPRSVLTLRVFTLSLDKNWLTV